MEVFAYKLSGLSWIEVSGVEQQRNVINSCEDKQKSNISFPTIQCTPVLWEQDSQRLFRQKSAFPNPKSRAWLYLIMIYNGLVIMTWSCVRFITSCFPSALTTSPFCSKESRWPRFNQSFFLFVFLNHRLHPSWSCLQLSLQHQIHAVLAHQRSDPHLHGNSFTVPWRCIRGRQRSEREVAGRWQASTSTLRSPSPLLFLPCTLMRGLSNTDMKM